MPHTKSIHYIAYAFEVVLDMLKIKPHITGSLRELYSDLERQLEEPPDEIPSSAKLEELIAQIKTSGLINPADENTLHDAAFAFWGSFLKLVSRLKGRVQPKEITMPVAPLILFKMPSFNGSGSALFLPAAADPVGPVEMPFRHEEVHLAHEILDDNQILIVGGYLTRDVSSFFLPNFLSSLEVRKASYWHLKYTDEIGRDVADNFRRDNIPQYIVLEWDDRMTQNTIFMDALQYAFLSDKSHRLVIINPKEGEPLHVSAEKAHGFSRRVLDDERTPIHVIGLVPKYLNPVQAAHHLFSDEEKETRKPATPVESYQTSTDSPEQALAGYAGMVDLISTYIPLLTPFLDHVKEMKKSAGAWEPLEEIIEEVLKDVRVNVPRTSVAVVVSGGKISAGFDASAFELLSHEKRLRQFESGHVLLLLSHEDDGSGTANPPRTEGSPSTQSGGTTSSAKSAKLSGGITAFIPSNESSAHEAPVMPLTASPDFQGMGIPSGAPFDPMYAGSLFLGGILFAGPAMRAPAPLR